MSVMQREDMITTQSGMVKHFWPFIKKYWLAFLIGPLLMAFEAYTDLKQPDIMRSLIDVGIANGDVEFIKSAGLSMVMYALIGLVAGVGAAGFCTYASLKFGASLREAVYKKVQSFSFGNMDRFHAGSLITRMTNDIVQISNATHQMIRMLVRSSSLFIGSLIYIILMSRELTVVLFIAAPFIVVIAYFATKFATPMFRKLQRKLDGVNTIMQENLAGVRVVKSFVRSDYEVKRFKHSNEDLMDTAVKGFRVLAIIGPIVGLVLNFSICAAVYIGGHSVLNGSIAIGDFISYLRYLSTLLMSLTMVAMTIIQLVRARASKDRVLEVLKVDPEINDDDAFVENYIKNADVEFKNVSFTYDKDGEEIVLNDISFSVKAGETIALLGSTGSGKTSLVNLIPRLYDISSGEILIDGINIKNYKLDYLRGSIGVSLQTPILFSGSIYDNIAYGKKDATLEDVIAVAKIAQAHDFIMELEDTYDYRIEQKGVNLSGGQKQRIAIARALLIHPKILVLDDSTSAIDVQTENKIQEGLKEIMKGCTSFVVAQRISTVLEADNILVLEDGYIVAEGNHETLMKTSEIYNDIYNSQLGNGE